MIVTKNINSDVEVNITVQDFIDDLETMDSPESLSAAYSIISQVHSCIKNIPDSYVKKFTAKNLELIINALKEQVLRFESILKTVKE